MLPDDAAATVEDRRPGHAGQTHDWALHTNDPRVVVARWADLSAAAVRAGEA
ncbi:hypothetical protein G3I15_41040, partial [Streptomyces sp. SID10244]|nr:hypothetical protein [Streptomyces sp. SID10244]